MNRPGTSGRGLPILPQTLLLVVGALLLAQLLSIAMIIALPPPRPAFTGLSEIAEALGGAPHRRGHGQRADAGTLRASPATTAPFAAAGMVQDAALTGELATRLGVSPDRVRLYYRPDDGPWHPYRRRSPDGGIVRRHGDPLFFDAVVAAVRREAGWRIVSTPERPLVSDWQWRWISLFLASVVVVLPFAWVFAGRLSRPIRRFAEAADRIGREPGAPHVPVEGPRELRVAAHAMNGMQDRIGAYVRERTAMVAAIAHDLRTPLARIAFRIEAAPEDIREPVHDDIRAMTEMISTTLDYAKGVAPWAGRERVDVARLLHRIGESARETGREVAIEAAGPCEVIADPVALRRLFQNLLDNAVKYGGEARVVVMSEPGTTVVEVRDRGPGLPEAMLDEVFEPFVRSDPSRSRTTGGVGLGLTIARGIALEHGGSLALANGAGGGLIATVRLPSAGDSQP